METPPTGQEPTPTDQQPCPKCQATLPVYQGYVTWCEACGWNLKPLESARPRNIFESFYVRMGQRWSKGLFEQLSRSASLRPTWTISKVLAFLIAALVHGATLLVLVVGVILIVQGWPNWFFVAIGVLALAIAWTLRPSFPQLNRADREHLATRSSCPTLYALADRIAQALHTRPVETIIVDEAFNASFQQVGWRRQRVLTLGLPLLSILDGQELVALIGHELAHVVNGDPSRSFFVGTAIRSLIQWHYFLYPRNLFDTSGRLEILSIPVKLLSLGLAWLVALVLNGLFHLVWRDSQRAEYLADALGAEVAGTEASLSLLGKQYYRRTFQLTVQQMSLRKTPGDLFGAVREHITRVPQRELDRIQQIEYRYQARFDATHPPTAFRRDFLRAHPERTPQVTVTPAEFAHLQQELATRQAPIQAELLDQYQSSLD